MYFEKEVNWFPKLSLKDKEECSSRSIGEIDESTKAKVSTFKLSDIEDGFGYVEGDYEYETINIDPGDVLFFHPLLIHKSGELKSDKTRWSCHYRFNNMKDKDFIDRNYPHPYIYKPIKLW